MKQGSDTSTRQEQYALLVLKDVLGDSLNQQDLLLPLTLAYLVSAQVRFLLPVPTRHVTQLEAAFDGILNGLALDSQGVSYHDVSAPADIESLLDRATVIITTDAQAQQMARARGLPCAFLGLCDGQPPQVELADMGKLKDEELKGRLAGFAQLINIQAGGLISRGPFSLSW